MRAMVDEFAKRYCARVALDAHGDFPAHYEILTNFGPLRFAAHCNWIACQWQDVGKSGHIHGHHPSGKWNHGPYPRWYEYGGERVYLDAMETCVSELRMFKAIP